MRLNYNFHNYAASWYEACELNTRTIEFREAARTMFGKWARVWASICIGLVDFSRGSTPTEFLDVLHRLTEQIDRDQSGVEHTDDERFNVCDFLEDIGLYAEAEFVRKRERESGPPR